MGLFYILSGFVMYLGYAQDLLADPIDAGCCRALCCVKCCDVCWANGRTIIDKGKPFRAVSFYIKRLARLGPVYYLTNLIGLIIVVCLKPAEVQTLLWRVPLTILGVSSLLMHTPIVDYFPVNDVSWTISTLAFFYIFFPFLAPRLQRGVVSGQERVAAICMYILQAFWPVTIAEMYLLRYGYGPVVTHLWYWFVRAFPVCRLPVFVMGCLAAKSIVDIHKKTGLQTACATPSCAHFGMANFGLVIYVLMVVLYVLLGRGLAGPFIASLMGEGGCRLIIEIMMPMLYYDWITALTTETSFTRSMLASRPMRFLGDISMSFYMIHHLVWDVFERATKGKWMQWSLPPLFIALVVSLLLGWAMTALFEKPAQKFLLRRLLPDPAESEVAADTTAGHGADVEMTSAIQGSIDEYDAFAPPDKAFQGLQAPGQTNDMTSRAVAKTHDIQSNQRH